MSETEDKVQFAFADELERACAYCATIARAKIKNWWEHRLIPKPDDPTATVTFIEFEARTFAVTAWHVIHQFQEAAISEGVHPESYFLPAEPGIGLHPPFLRPPATWLGKQPDVGITPIHPDLPGHIGKRAFALSQVLIPDPVPYAMAVGFPTASKSLQKEDLGNRVAMQCAHAVAEGVGSHSDSDQAQFWNILKERPSSDSLSGMSGGPVFWSRGNTFGLFGFVKEAMDVAPKPGEETLYTDPRVHFMCQRVSYETFASWVVYLDQNYQRERDALARLVSAG